MNKRILSLIAMVLALAMMVACGGGTTSSAASGESSTADSGAASGETASTWEWERDIEIVCTFDVGSGTDTTLRAIMPEVEKIVGVNIIINNVSGASGVNGAEFFNQQPADGYTYAMYTPSHTIAAYNGTTSFDILNETAPVICLVQDSNLIFSNVNLPFSDVQGMIDYAKENPGKLTLSLQSVTGIDAVSAQQFFDLAGIDVTLVAADGSEAYSMVIGGHADMTLGSIADGQEYVKAGQLNALVILSPERSSVLTEVPTSVELGYDATIGPWRAIVAKKGTPQEAIDAFEAAIAEVCQNSESWEEWKIANGLNDRDGYFNQEEMTQMWFDYYNTVEELLGDSSSTAA
jgi:tripartite-type tricarboxylate transporter receptor subunit TctC